MAWNRKTNTRVSSKNIIANPVGVKQSIAVLSFTLLFAACGGDSGSGAKAPEPAEGANDGRPSAYSEVETVKDLGRCTGERDGDTVYVAEKLTDFLCQNKTWVDLSEVANTSSSDADTNGKSSSSKGTESPSVESSSSSVNGAESTSSSSFNKDAYTGDNLVVKDRSILGVAQKGPFKFGSPVYLRELTKDKLEYTGMVYQDEINSNKGDFVIPKVNFISPYASIEVRGLYRNELTGDYSKDSISLFALTDLTTRTKVNVNLLTHLEYSRAMYLVRKGYGVDAAKKQASQEIMTAFELPTTVSSSEDLSVFEDAHDNNVNYANASLLMMSLLFLREGNDAELKKTIDKFVADFEKDGSWEDEETKTAMADFASELSPAVVRVNIAAWNILDIPNFEAPLETFWNNVYGLGGCTESRSNVILKNKNAKSKNADVCYKCDVFRSSVYPYEYTRRWVRATQLENDTYEQACSEDGALISGNLNKEAKYVCDAGAFRVANEQEISLDKGCVSYTEGDEIRKPISNAWDTIYTCTSNLWVGELKIRDGFMLDERDQKLYRTVVIGNQTWMAENLNYKTQDSYCYENEASNCSKYGRFYTWYAAIKACPSGWHLPTTAEFETLFTTVGGKSTAGKMLKATNGWNYGGNRTDAFGFSALPAGTGSSDGNYSGDGNDAYFWSYTENYSSYAYSMGLRYSYDHATLDGYYKGSGLSVRCLKD